MNEKSSLRIFATVAFLVLAVLATGCDNRKNTNAKRSERAMQMFTERCKYAGEKIHKNVRNVDGIFVMKLRPETPNFSDQFALNDPYGHDLGGKLGYIGSFLRGEYQATHTGIPKEGKPPRRGYNFAEAVNPSDGHRYRYSGRIEEPWQTDKKYLKGYQRFVIDSSPALGDPPRYGVTYEDISTREEREYWIAGSLLKVIDLSSGETIAERRGYMVDWAQGSQAGGRSPWIFAANNACPSFSSKNGFRAQSYQALDFVEKVLLPSD